MNLSTKFEEILFVEAMKLHFARTNMYRTMQYVLVQLPVWLVARTIARTSQLMQKDAKKDHMWKQESVL